MYISKYVRTAVAGDLGDNRRSKSKIEVSLEECGNSGPRPGSEKIQKGFPGTFFLHRRGGKSQIPGSKLEFWTSFRKIDVNFCAQAQRFWPICKNLEFLPILQKMRILFERCADSGATV